MTGRDESTRPLREAALGGVLLALFAVLANWGQSAGRGPSAGDRSGHWSNPIDAHVDVRIVEVHDGHVVCEVTNTSGLTLGTTWFSAGRYGPLNIIRLDDRIPAIGLAGGGCPVGGSFLSEVLHPGEKRAFHALYARHQRPIAFRMVLREMHGTWHGTGSDRRAPWFDFEDFARCYRGDSGPLLLSMRPPTDATGELEELLEHYCGFERVRAATDSTHAFVQGLEVAIDLTRSHLEPTAALTINVAGDGSERAAELGNRALARRIAAEVHELVGGSAQLLGEESSDDGLRLFFGGARPERFTAAARTTMDRYPQAVVSSDPHVAPLVAAREQWRELGRPLYRVHEGVERLEDAWWIERPVRFQLVFPSGVDLGTAAEACRAEGWSVVVGESTSSSGLEAERRSPLEFEALTAALDALLRITHPSGEVVRVSWTATHVHRNSARCMPPPVADGP